MKKPTLLAVCAVLFGLAFSAAAQAQAVDRGVAVIDLKRIFDEYPRFKQAKDVMNRDVEAAEARIKGFKAQLDSKKKERSELNQNSQAYERLDRQIIEEEFKLRAMVTQTRKQFLKREANMYFTAYKEIIQEVEAYATHFHFSMVLRYNSSLLDKLDMPDVRKVAQTLNKPVVWLRPNNPQNIFDPNNRDITGAILHILKKKHGDGVVRRPTGVPIRQ